jgi:cell division septation protein DedD
MLINKIVLVVCCAMVIGLSGCSRQQSDWQKARETNTADAYEQFLKKYPSGEFTAQAQARVKEVYEERDWQKARDADTAEAYQAFVKQYPEGKWTEEARIRIENFTLAQTPVSGAASSPQGPPPGAVPPDASPPAKAPAAGPATAPAKPANPPASSQKHEDSAAVQPGSYGIQLGAFKSGSAAANKRWAQLQSQYPTLLTGLTSKVSPRKNSSGTLYRLQVADLSEKRASSICKALKTHAQPCVLLHP